MTRPIIVDTNTDPGAMEDQLRAAIAEARRCNTPEGQAVMERLASGIRTEVEAQFPDVDLHQIRTVIVGICSRLNAIHFQLDPGSMYAVGVTQTILGIALYGQPGD